MVFAVHFGQITSLQGVAGPFDVARLMENGNTGVALFFALSGFLLCLPYWKALISGTPRPPTGVFLRRRAARILPAYFACLTILIVVNRFWQKSDWERDVLLHYSLVFNYFDATIFRINPPFWTLAVEAQFYLLVPLLFLLADRMSAARTAALMLALIVVTYFAHYFIVSHAAVSGPSDEVARVSPVLTYSLMAHLPHFLLGAVTAWIFLVLDLKARSAPGRLSFVFEATLWVAALLVFIVLSTRIADVLTVPYGRYNFPFVPFLLCVIILLTPVTSSGRVLLDSAPLRWIGAISYGIYIYHLPIQHAVARYMTHFSLAPRENWLVFGIASLGLTFAVAAASYWALEKPILNAVKVKR